MFSVNRNSPVNNNPQNSNNSNLPLVNRSRITTSTNAPPSVVPPTNNGGGVANTPIQKHNIASDANPPSPRSSGQPSSNVTSNQNNGKPSTSSVEVSRPNKFGNASGPDAWAKMKEEAKKESETSSVEASRPDVFRNASGPDAWAKMTKDAKKESDSGTISNSNKNNRDVKSLDEVIGKLFDAMMPDKIGNVDLGNLWKNLDTLRGSAESATSRGVNYEEQLKQYATNLSNQALGSACENINSALQQLRWERVRVKSNSEREAAGARLEQLETLSNLFAEAKSLALK